ncbi:TetR/AcrR family transcriptional regulator [Actinoplanes sp. NPDC023936]|uniref:TetR/AcrR family transcriptional regulator n=1 Tax=Actinoplanes sp. NPDC023936 TaxID=3154910 RepID=UPI0033CDA558
MAKTGGGAGTKGVPRADREQQILDAAVQGFAERGFAYASMAAIAQRAGISKPLVYEYFGSKEGLYLACLNRAGEHLVGHVVDAQNGTTLGRAGETLAAIFAALDGRRLDWVILTDPTLPAGSAVHEAASGYRDRLHRLAVEGTREVLAGRGLTDDQDHALSAHVWEAVVTAVVNWWLAHPAETAAAMTQRCDRVIEALSAVNASTAAGAGGQL